MQSATAGAAFAEPAAVGNWKYEKKLGAGGFGVVSLWRNTQTQQQIAVKRCHPLADTDKHADSVRRRWNDEVLYMTERVQHENIVRGVRVDPPAFLEALQALQPGGMPVLMMEYCEAGDLRRQLNTVDNACGFGEREARAILRSLGAAIAHLHRMKIAHRDIKPENIVIGTAPNGRRLYKLTDLGYAKVLDHQTLVASLVGTLEYVAPELCLTDRYTNSVDYWSMGVIAYEICTGVRPFVPHVPFVKWMPLVRSKRSTHIAIDEPRPEEFRYLERLPAEHRLSDALAERLALWLRLALEWNPKQRGQTFAPATGDDAPKTGQLSNALPPKLELRIFTQLQALLDVRVMRVFCLRTMREHSAELSDERERMAGLVDWLAGRTGTTPERMRIVLPVAHPWTGACNMDTRPLDLWWPNDDEDGRPAAAPMLYVYAVDESPAMQRSASSTTLNGAARLVRPAPPPPELPECVRQVLAEGVAAVAGRPHAERRFAACALHVCRQQQQLYRHALGGWHALALRLNHEVQLADGDVERMRAAVYRLDGSLTVQRDSLRRLAETAAERLTRSQSTGGGVTDLAMRERFARLAEHVRCLVQACERIAKRYASVHRRSWEACGRRVFDRRAGGGADLFGVERTAKTLEILRCRQANRSSVDGQLRELRQAVEAVVQRRNELLQETDWLELLELPALAFEIEEIKKAIRMAIEQVAQFQLDVQSINGELFACIREQALSDVQQRKTPSTGQSDAGYLPAIDGIGEDAATPPASVEFHIGQAVTPMPVATKASASLGAAAESGGKSLLMVLSDVKTSTLVSSNEEMLLQMQEMIRQLNDDIKLNES